MYWARDNELGRDVAIKELRRDLFTSPADVDRLMEEARTVARLNHPAIVPLHDVIRGEDDTLYLVMRYIDGGSLRELLRSRPK